MKLGGNLPPGHNALQAVLKAVLDLLIVCRIFESANRYIDCQWEYGFTSFVLTPLYSEYKGQYKARTKLGLSQGSRRYMILVGGE